jgi:hypothetical protein
MIVTHIRETRKRIPCSENNCRQLKKYLTNTVDLKIALSNFRRMVYSGMLVLTRATRPNIPEDTIFHSHRSENIKSYISNFRLLIVIARLLSSQLGLEI